MVNISGLTPRLPLTELRRLLLNQAVIEGKPIYAHSSTSYLPHSYLSNHLVAFFLQKRSHFV